ncbi:hypothetical protein TIFTF001_047127 [Ficus carica]|uniref:Glycosyltransferase n=1 Tax=Ficus carica TaxID=3494 RepID=A0AA88CHS5_FICCA|nr:hypothetical protein TIFTF001_047127 [Ficus carica]
MARDHDHNPHQQDHTAINRPSLPPVVVVMVPFPAHSHLNQLLQLSHIISSHNIKVHYVGSALHNSQVKSRATRILNPERIEFHDFPTPRFLSPSPNNIKFPSHQMPSFEATVNNLRQPVKSLLTSVSETARRVVVIHDLLTSSAVQDATSLPDTEAYIFNSISAISKFAFLRDVMGFKAGDHPEIPLYEDDCHCVEFEAFLAYQFQFVTSNKSGHLYNTSRLLESNFLDLIQEIERETNPNMKLWAIGPLETVTIFKQISNSSSRKQKDCLEWLDKHKPNSVLYVSFGTTTFMEDEQIRELALGLEQSDVKFLWVLRDADKGNVFDEVRRPQLPDGFEERAKEKGMVVRDWAPQLEILGHSSTGGFMSHCGWNSCLESISLGVPIAAWPLHSDQPLNAVLITELLKVGVAVRNWAQSDGLVSSSAIRDAVKRLMDSKEGDEVRNRAEKLGCELRKSAVEGGVSDHHMGLDSFVAHITR